MMGVPLTEPGFGLGRAGRAVARNLGWLLASKGVLAVLSLFYLGFAARALGVTGFGRFALITGAAQALATLVAFQSWKVIVQYGVGLVRTGDEVGLARLLKGAAILDLLSAVIGSVVAVIILEIWSEQLGISPTLKRATLIFAVVQVITIRSTPLGILRLRDQLPRSAMADSATAVARFVGAGLVTLIHPTVQGFMVVWALAEIVTSGIYWTMVACGGDLALLKRGGNVGRLLRDHPGIVRFALSTNASATLALSSKQVPLLAVGAVLGPSAAGVFRLAGQLAQGLAKVSQLVARAAFSEIVRAVQGRDRRGVRRLLLRSVGASLLGGLLILLIVVLIGEPVLTLVAGREVKGGYPILVAMAAAGCVEFAATTFDTVMTARGEAGTVFVIRCVGVAVLAAVAVVAMPLFGATGMAAAVLIGSLAAVLLMAVVCWWRLRPDAEPEIA
ncbi:lipopolysaccharide biosynthesis protein [uncultured Sphingomonas sp.]|uniref:lipopolysaccharide biosynthesis protein n=1 Tax=uncultured Sphingomonas sp. TaxID=158754 RepID=UPI0035CB1489